MSQNARIIHKDIMTGVVKAANGSSEVIDLFGSDGGASKLSCQAIYDVQTPGAKTFASGRSSVDTYTFASLAGTSASDYLVVYDTTGSPWALAANKTGSDPAPTGAIWVSVPSAQKAQVDISGATTASDVAALFATAFGLLTSAPFTAVATTTSVAVTQTVRGIITAPSVHNADDSGAGSISVVVTTAGINSAVNITADTIAITAHGFPLGFKVRLTTTGTLPAGLALLTDYFIIVVDANTIKLASSLAHALANTPVDITGQGSSAATNTVTGVALAGASITFQKSNSTSGPWTNIQAATAISADGAVYLHQPNVSYRYFKAVKALTAGVVDLKALTLVIGGCE